MLASKKSSDERQERMRTCIVFIGFPRLRTEKRNYSLTKDSTRLNRNRITETRSYLLIYCLLYLSLQMSKEKKLSFILAVFLLNQLCVDKKALHDRA